MPWIPERIRWAVELLDVDPADRMLEIGCGNGVAAGLVCDSIEDGHLTAIDRSATSIARARERNAHHLEAGCLTLACCDLAGFPGEGAPFDKVFAMNVNVFWAKDASREIERLERLVAPGGRLWLVSEAPDPARMGAELAPSIAERLRRVGFSPRVETTERLCAVIACH